MIRIALYDTNVEEGRKLRNILGSYARNAGIFCIEILLGNSYDDFLKIIGTMREGYFKMAVLRVSETGDDILDRLENLLSQLNEMTPSTDITVISDDSHHALNAYHAGARFLKMPFDEKMFVQVIGQSLQHTAAVNKHPFAVKSGKTVKIMNINEIIFAETNRKGPVIHLADGRIVDTQGTLQALFDRLSSLGDKFFRAGGSFIVNLDNIRSVGDSSVVFANGETIILPVRARKPVQESFLARQRR